MLGFFTIRPDTATSSLTEPCCSMTSVGQRHARCFVVGCKNQHRSLYRTPASEVLRAEWIKFIYDGKVPATVNKHLYVCAHHFEPFYFHNLGQYKVGLSRKLFIKEQAVPTLRGEAPGDVKQVRACAVCVRAGKHELGVTHTN